MNRLTAEKIKVADFPEMEVKLGFIYELINGEIAKKGAPCPKHQKASGKLSLALSAFVKRKQLNDRGDKMKIYRQHKVREYWIVDPKGGSIEVY